MLIDLKIQNPTMQIDGQHLTTIDQVHRSGVELTDPNVLFYTPDAFEAEFGVSHKRLGLDLVTAPSPSGTTVAGIPVLAPGEKCTT
jgi:hypothetical protein